MVFAALRARSKRVADRSADRSADSSVVRRPARRRLRRTGTALTGLSLVAGALAVTALTPAPQTEKTQPVFESSCIGYCQHPTNAQKVFRWGLEAWKDEFEVGGLSSHWRSNRRSQIGQQIGMLTIKTVPGLNTLKVWPDNQKAQYGRWEARVRAREWSTTGAHYQFNWELVPVRGDQQRCGANNIVIGSYRPDDNAAVASVRRGTVQFTASYARDLRSRAWHTYAVEVTPDHISWFVDTRVIATERRPEALSGIRYKPQFRIEATPGKQMRQSWMQMDWARYYTLKRPNVKSIAAPQLTRTSYSGGC